jgi:hypothetical protein
MNSLYFDEEQIFLENECPLNPETIFSGEGVLMNIEQLSTMTESELHARANATSRTQEAGTGTH